MVKDVIALNNSPYFDIADVIPCFSFVTNLQIKYENSIKKENTKIQNNDSKSSGSSYLFTTYVASWLATVLLYLGWSFNGTFTD